MPSDSNLYHICSSYRIDLLDQPPGCAIKPSIPQGVNSYWPFFTVTSLQRPIGGPTIVRLQLGRSPCCESHEQGAHNVRCPVSSLLPSACRGPCRSQEPPRSSTVTVREAFPKQQTAAPAQTHNPSTLLTVSAVPTPGVAVWTVGTHWGANTTAVVAPILTTLGAVAW